MVKEKIDYLRFTTIWKSPVTHPNTCNRRERAKLQGLTMDRVDRAMSVHCTFHPSRRQLLIY
ncbi:hypothetical protein T10_8176 [Trichinella papuae]|uniref:Uncharacterized protein n=1 Tax=Trichinella papuae TaxID=268474 RepID=A0A0V1NAA6_9BILA|nr:hypothetical protein T10_8176 [Trichinella papuae]